MSVEELKKHILEVPDFPKPGILFKDLSPLLLEPAVFQSCLDQMRAQISDLSFDAIAGIESRGFWFGLPLAREMGLPFIPIRKVGKLPRATSNVHYSLEYGNAGIEVHREDVAKFKRILLHDDLLATGGTAAAAHRLLEENGAQVAALHFVVELSALGGRGLLEKLGEVRSLVQFA